MNDKKYFDLYLKDVYLVCKDFSINISRKREGDTFMI